MSHLTDRISELNALGDPESIARFLESRGIQGRLGQACQCPVTRYLSKDAPEDREFAACNAWVESRTLYGRKIEEVQVHGTPVGQFVSMFDGGAFPALVHREGSEN